MATKKSQKTDNESKQLNLFNFGLAIIFFIQAILVVLLSRNVLVPVNTHFLTKDNLASQAAGHIVWAEASRHLFDIRLANLLALILVIAAIVHLLAATAYRATYEKDLQQVNRLRWLEYGIDGGLMLVAIALVNGVADISTLFMIFMFIFGLGLLLILMEQLGQLAKPIRWSIDVLAIITFVVPWIIIACYLFDAAVFGASRLPTFVYWLDLSIFILLAAATGTFYAYKHKIGSWADAYYTEKTFMALSLAVKTALVWQIFFGRLR